MSKKIEVKPHLRHVPGKKKRVKVKTHFRLVKKKTLKRIFHD